MARNEVNADGGGTSEIGGAHSTKPRDVRDSFAYLLKHARERLTSLNAEAFGPLGIDGRDLAVLTVLDGAEPASQYEAARRLGVDRTTMVALIDGLEAHGLVVRRPDPADRRRNVVALTGAGRQTLAAGTRAADEVEAVLLAALTEEDRERFRKMLRAIVFGDEGAHGKGDHQPT